jgi:hypothetical protein
MQWTLAQLCLQGCWVLLLLPLLLLVRLPQLLVLTNCDEAL